MACAHGGTNLTDEQVRILKQFVENHERRGMPICSCDVERVIYMDADDATLARLNPRLAERIVRRRTISNWWRNRATVKVSRAALG
jgi:hypothetical protein